MDSNTKYINPFTDFGFKKLFGEEAAKDSLISFLNDLLPIDSKIVDITFENTEQLGINRYARKSVYDIYCVDDKNSHFIVELQNAEQDYFKDRALFYSTFPIQRQAKRGKKWDFRLDHVYCIGLLGFLISDAGNVNEEVLLNREYLHEVKLKDQKNQVFYDKLTFIFIEFPNFKKTADQLDNHLEKWLYFFQHLDDMDTIPEALKEPVFNHAFANAAVAALSHDDLTRYESSLKAYRDNINTMQHAIDKALQKGLQKGEKLGLQKGEKLGLQKGREAERLVIVRAMVNAEMSVADIAKITSLDIDVVKAIMEKLKN